ncbi:hypothetical protein T439DRAFT_357452 [Meredithblackwellia eburnea MCA 4105]
MVRSPSQEAIDTESCTLPSIADVLKDQTLLITGGAGFVGTALLYRLVASDLSVRRVYTVIRGENPISRLPVDLHPFVAKRLPDGTWSTEEPIVILPGDCFLPDFGLGPKDAKLLREIQIVIHTAGDTRFSLPLAQAVHAIADLATAMTNFSLNNLRVRTHIHLSTTFTGWFLESGSTVLEELVPALDESAHFEEHANTYLHAKSIAEGLVNAVGRPQAGRPTPKVNWRIVRLATVGPAVQFPFPGFGAGSPSSPVCSAIAAEVVGREHYLDSAELDVIPLDIAVNQILGLTASVHARKSTVLPRGSNVPIYHIAAGMAPENPIPMHLLNEPDCKIKEPYVPAKNLLRAYSPMITKCVKFDTSRTRVVLGLAPQTKAPKYNIDPSYGLTVPVTDTTIDTLGFECDGQKAVDAIGGWRSYLQLIRDRMEQMAEPESFEVHVD